MLYHYFSFFKFRFETMRMTIAKNPILHHSTVSKVHWCVIGGLDIGVEPFYLQHFFIFLNCPQVFTGNKPTSGKEHNGYNLAVLNNTIGQYVWTTVRFLRSILQMWSFFYWSWCQLTEAWTVYQSVRGWRWKNWFKLQSTWIPYGIGQCSGK